MNRLLSWLDDRTGYQGALHEALYENIPGGSRWRYVFGSTLVFTFSVQVVTGLFLWMCYSPSGRSAWESVYYIQYEMQGGWLLRGLHHFTAQAMIVLLALHLVQVVWDGAYRAPREVNFWLGLVLMQLVLGLSLTGYLLPWDQKGFWATRVATNLMGLVPYVGDELQRLLVGGPRYGHLTLTRFFALHAGLLPMLLTVVLVLHLAVFRRHGIKAVHAAERPGQKFWPDQALKDAVACLIVLAAVLGLVFLGQLTREHEGDPPESYLGAELGAPADPANPYNAARPEWYFLFLFQFLKYFHGETEVIGAIVVPGFVMFVLFLMPLVGRWRVGHALNVLVLAALGVCVLGLTTVAIMEDRDKDNHEFQRGVQLAEENRARVIQLAQRPTGIPEAGGGSLLRNDPKTQGPVLFVRHCASCHSHMPRKSGVKAAGRHAIESQTSTGANLYGFGSHEWVAGLLDPGQVASPDYFGNTSHEEMAGYVQQYMVADSEEWSQEQIESVVAALVAEGELLSENLLDSDDPSHETLQAQIAAGVELIQDTERCAQCHKFYQENEDAYAPDLTGYASRQWMIDFISDPTHDRFYGERNDRMPVYAKNPDDPLSNVLTELELGLVVDWLRGDWYEPEQVERKAPEKEQTTQ